MMTRSLALLAAALVPQAALAHGASERVGDFWGALFHLLTEGEYLLGILALGLLGAQGGIRRSQGLLAAFPLGLALGAALAQVDPHLSGSTAWNLTAALVLGLLVALARPLPPALLAVLGGLTGLGLGYGNALALTGAEPLLLVPGLALGGLLACGYTLVAGDWVWRGQRQWPPIALRVAGSWIATIALLMLGLQGRPGP